MNSIFEWKRPQLPQSHQTSMVVFGQIPITCGILFSVVGALLIIIHDPGEYNSYLDTYSGGTDTFEAGVWCMVLGVSTFSIGFMVFLASSVLLEIRQSAFEAALRHGEVREVERQKTAYEHMLEQDNARPSPNNADD